MTTKTPEQIAEAMMDPSGDATALLRDFPDSRKAEVQEAIVAAIAQDRRQHLIFDDQELGVLARVLRYCDDGRFMSGIGKSRLRLKIASHQAGASLRGRFGTGG